MKPGGVFFVFIFLCPSHLIYSVGIYLASLLSTGYTAVYKINYFVTFTF